MRPIEAGKSKQRGMVLIASLLLLLVVTIMAIAMFRGYGLQEKIAGNLREKQRAFHAAQTAELYAETWLTSGNNATSTPVTCNSVLNANLGEGQICSNVLTQYVADVRNIPWQITSGTSLVPVGVTYTVLDTATPMTVTQTSGLGTYYGAPTFYISYLGASPTGQGSVFQIDAYGYGATPSAASVVESTYLVGPEVQCLSCQ